MRTDAAIDMIAEDVIDRLDQQAEGCTDREYRRLCRRVVNRLCDRLASRKAGHSFYPKHGRAKRCQTE